MCVCVRVRVCVTNAKTADLVTALQDSGNMLTTLLKAPPSCIERDTPPLLQQWLPGRIRLLQLPQHLLVSQQHRGLGSQQHRGLVSSQITSTTTTCLNHDIYENYPDA